MRFLILKALVGLILLALPLNASSNRLHDQLAAFHAPILFQEVGLYPKGDALTRFDFDGDFVGTNNWENLDTHATPAYVYYDVKETHTHYFIMYAFFHPRDYSYMCVPLVCHENDLEGAMLMIEKNSIDRNGKIVAIQTLAHDRIYTHEDMERHIEIEGARTLASNFSTDTKASFFIEWGGHGVYGWDPIKKSKFKEEKPAPLFSYDQILSTAQTEYTKDWLVYHLGDHADDPNGASRGIYHYQLLSLHDELWERRQEVGEDRVYLTLYNFKGVRFKIPNVPGAFAGRKWSDGRARPPWAWNDNYVKGENRGEWFIDPAFYVTKKLKNYSNQISLDYTQNPYVP